MANFNFNYRGFPRRNIVNDRRFGGGQQDTDLHRVNEQITILRNEVQTLSSSLLNLYNISQTNNVSISNIENMLNNRYNRSSRVRPFFMSNSTSNNSQNTLHQDLNEIERLINLVSGRPVSQSETRNQTLNSTLNPGSSATTTATHLNNNTTNTTNTDSSIPNAPTPNTNRTNSQVDSILFNSLMDTLNNDLNSPMSRNSPMASFIPPNILEVTYTPESLTNNITNLFRNINTEEDSTSVITTHATINRNTEIIVKETEGATPEATTQEGATPEATTHEGATPEATQNIDNFCVICHENINRGQVLRKIKKCRHCFHIGCLDRWLENKITCPTCRADIRLNLNNRVQQNYDNRNQSEATTNTNR